MKLPTARPGCFPPVAALIGWAMAILGMAIFRAEIGHWGGPATAGSVLLLLVGAPLGLFGTLLLVFGDTYLEVDVRAGTARYMQLGRVRWSAPLAELGALAIRTQPKAFELVAEGRADVLFRDADESKVRARKDLIEALQAQSAVRSILALTVEDSEFRGAPDMATQARQAIPDHERLRAAVTALREDADADVRTRAEQLLQELDRG